MKQGQFPAVLPLVSLNGKNGFKLDGEATNGLSGHSVSAAGDVNGDGYADLLIGAPYSSAGRSYVVFGGAEVGRQGLIPLSTLNGTNGFRLDGEASGDRSGISLSAAGDVNGDGHADFLIGAYGHAAKGRSYVVFGGSGVGGQGLILLSSLNGVNGFKLDGEAADDYSGQSVSSAGDVNGDGYTDLLIGAYCHPYNWTSYSCGAGRSYVVFGGLGVGYQGLISLSTLNSTNGFKLNGEAQNDKSGYVVSTAGDVNGDGYADLLIGAPSAISSKSRSYVVFGGAEAGYQGPISLSALNGTNGFKLDGEAMGSIAGNGQGYSVSTAGDVNGDGYVDLLIGVSCYPYTPFCGPGRSYVVFGGAGVGYQGRIFLSSLNGTNGFKLDGEAQGDNSGWSVSSAGDINGDGYADLLIGAWSHAGQTGRSYVVFGGSGIVAQGLLSLSVLDGMNGFKLDGEALGDQSGYSVSIAGDVNGDGLVDILIGAHTHNSSIGRSYVVFGDTPPVLVQNRLTLQTKGNVLFNSTFLSAYDRNHKNSTLIFFPTNVNHGRFESVKQPGVAITNFTQPQLLNGTVQFVHDGSLVAPSYEMSVRSPGIAWTGPIAANITFSQVLVIVNNRLIIHQGQTLVMTTSLLSVIDSHSANQVIFNVNNLQHGKFQLLPGNTTVLQFTEQELIAGQVLFVQDGSSSAPSYQIGVTDNNYTLPIYSTVNTTFYRQPMITTNSFVIYQGGIVKLTTSDITVVDDYPPSEITFTINQVKHGQFQLLPSNVSVSQFTEQQLMAGQVTFSQDGSVGVPTYQLSVSDPYVTLPPVASTSIDFYHHPIFFSNQLTLFEGETLMLTTANINVTDSYPDTQVLFTVNDCQHGQFELITAKNSTTIQFTQQQIKANQIQFVHDNQPYPPAYNLSVTDGYFTVGPVNGDIHFILVNKPPFLNNTVPSEVFAVGQPFNFKIDAGIFYDEQGKPLRLAAGLAGGLQLPSDIAFDPSTTTFTGIVNKPESYNVSITATSIANLKTSTYFQLQIVGSALQNGSPIDIKTVVSVVVSIGGTAISVLSYLYRQYRVNKNRERQNPFANAIHQRLRLAYPDFSDKDGKRYADAVNQMVNLIKTKSGVDIDELGLSTQPEDQQSYNRYADLFATEIQKKVKINKVCCGTGQELHLKNLEKRVEAIVDAVGNRALQPEEKLQRSSWCEFFCYRREALIIEKSSDLELAGMSSSRPRDEGMSESKSTRQTPAPVSIFTEPKIPEQEPGAEGEGMGEMHQPGEESPTSTFT